MRIKGARGLKPECLKPPIFASNKIRRLEEKGVIGRQLELVGKRDRLNDGPLLLGRVRELAVALQIACECVTQRAEDALLLRLRKQRYERRGVKAARGSEEWIVGRIRARANRIGRILRSERFHGGGGKSRSRNYGDIGGERVSRGGVVVFVHVDRAVRA